MAMTFKKKRCKGHHNASLPLKAIIANVIASVEK